MRNNTPPASKADAQGHFMKCSTKVKIFCSDTTNNECIICF